MRTLEKLWTMILERLEVNPNLSLLLAIQESDFTEDEGDAIFRDTLYDEKYYESLLALVNSRIKYHRTATRQKQS